MKSLNLTGFSYGVLALHKQAASTPQEQEMIERQIESTDATIDRLVYDLYELTEEDTRIVEEEK